MHHPVTALAESTHIAQLKADGHASQWRRICMRRRQWLTVCRRSTSPRLAAPTARARSARSVSRPAQSPRPAHTEDWQTPSTRSRSTRPARLRCSPRESVVMTVSRAVMVVRLSPSSTRYGPRTFAARMVAHNSTACQDHQEGRSEARVHPVQGTTPAFQPPLDPL